tara:strand:+ start:100 stop:654 length:555 start_codon:yes stop_codon:yes gene_type:complete
MSNAFNLARFGAYKSGSIIEEVSSPCDGSQITVGSGAYTVQDVTAVQNGTTGYVDLTGSTLAYTPPSIATRVVYEFSFQATYVDGYGVSNYKFFIDSDEVVSSRFAIRGTNWGHKAFFKCVINIGGSADTDDGRLASWTSAKTLKMQMREYNSFYEVMIHQTNSWDGASATQFCKPTISIKAIL